MVLRGWVVLGGIANDACDKAHNGAEDLAWQDHHTVGNGFRDWEGELHSEAIADWDDWNN